MDNPPGSASRFATFIRHLAEMLVAMFVGMAVLGVLLASILGLAGAPTALDDRPVLAMVAMAVEMTLPMAAWMAYRGHRGRDVAEMSASMLIPAVVLALGALAGPIGPHDAMGIYHPTMLVAMVGLMLARFDTYSSHAHHPQADHEAEVPPLDRRRPARPAGGPDRGLIPTRTKAAVATTAQLAWILGSAPARASAPLKCGRAGSEKQIPARVAMVRAVQSRRLARSRRSGGASSEGTDRVWRTRRHPRSGPARPRRPATS